MKVSLSNDQNIKPEKGAFERIVKVFDEEYPNLDSLPHYIDGEQFVEDLNQIKDAVKCFDSKKQLLHIGIGGSSLGPELLVKMFGRKKEVFFIKNSDPEHIEKVFSEINFNDCLFFIVSKSGSTIEPLIALSVLDQKLMELGVEISSTNSIVCTDPSQSELLTWANQKKIQALRVPASIGGRFSIFTPPALFPALFSGVNIEELILGAKTFFSDNSASLITTHAKNIVTEYRNGKTETVLFPYSSELSLLGEWFVQLWSESLGKNENVGLTPIVAIGATDQHSMLQLFSEGPKNKYFIFISNEKPSHDFELKPLRDYSIPSLDKISEKKVSEVLLAQQRGVMKDFEQKNIPLSQINISGICEKELGSLLTYLMFLTACIGSELKINPFNQPGVEISKTYARQFLI